ncbi:hypothetical protein [Maribellus maritimus]|uniref:hypothetical protein n=1 Tax=Maribellus maritimus TaxID=2870838 RepID=UPI001EEA81CF|nr:hypothetical protein [Maribellus maritimus]MCG6190306.1 hypothetical protein [Maribellus maritimus]
MRNIIYLLICSLFLVSCSANRYLNYINTKINNDIKVNLNVDSISIFDHRTNISDSDIKLPFMSHPKQLVRNIPPIDSTHIETIKNTIKQSCSGDEERVRINVNIVEAYKEFSATFASEKEKVYVEIQLDMVDSQSNLSVLCSSHAEYDLTVSDAKHKNFEELYLLAFKGAIITCLEKVKNEPNTPYTND